MKKTWKPKGGLSNPLPSGKGAGKTPVVRRVGAIPLISHWFAKMRISSREKAIEKVGDKLKKIVIEESRKIEDVIKKVEKTDLHGDIVRARALRDKLEEAACAKVKFDEDDDDGGSAIPGLTDAEIAQLKKECADEANKQTGMAWDSSRGHFSTKDPAKLVIAKKWQDTFNDCGKQKGL